MKQATLGVIDAVNLSPTKVKKIVSQVAEKSPRKGVGSIELSVPTLEGRQALARMGADAIGFQVATFFMQHDERVKSVTVHQGFRHIAGLKRIRLDITLHPSK